MFKIKNYFYKNITTIILIILSIFTMIFCGGNYFNWLLVIFVTYNIIANNFIQTMGVFIASNKNKSKIRIIYFFVIIFIITVLSSWLFFDRQLHFSLLNDVKYNENLSISLIILPIILSLLTKYKMPVSATFLIIPVFANKNIVHTMITKTCVSYLLSFAISLFLWKLIYKKYSYILENKNKVNNIWILLEYISTGTLWSVWLITSICSFVIFLPRVFDLKHLILFIIIGSVSTFIVILNGGGKIQEIIEEKSSMNNIKTTVIFNSMFSITMLLFQYLSKIPMTSTWMFLGMLGGRELAITLCNEQSFFNDNKYRNCISKICKDLNSATCGIVLSLLVVKILHFITTCKMILPLLIIKHI